MSTPRDFSLDLVATQPQTLYATGRFVGIIDAPDAPLNVEIDGSPALLRGPGGSVLLAQQFKRVRFTSTVTQTVRVLIADEVQDVSNIVTGSGGSSTINVTVEETPAATISTPAADAILTAAALAIAANLNRKRITIAALSTNTGSVFIQATGAGAGRGIELQPGLFVEIRNTAAIDVRNDSGATQTVMRFEES